MKNFTKLSILSLFSVLVFISCETTELDLTANPNALGPDQASADLFINAIQEDFAYFVNNMGSPGLRLTRQLHGFFRDYDNAYTPIAWDGVWSTAYQGIMEDIRLMTILAKDANLSYYVGMGEVFQAYIYISLVDYFGDVPYSEALQGSANLNPSSDGGQSVYQAALGLLDSAIANFSAGSAGPQYDMYYGGDAEKWITAANSIKKKAYLNMGDYSSYNSITDYITSSAEDFQFQWGTNVSNPDTRSPIYRSNYTDNGASDFQSNWLMNRLMVGRGGVRDPRINYLIYRQQGDTPGIDGPVDETLLQCAVPGFFIEPHRIAYGIYCGLPEGYWGRDHGDDSGINPDQSRRAITGIYPSGGTYDSGEFVPQYLDDGAGGAGITPIILSSWMNFFDAEVAVMTGGDPTAGTLAGIESFFNKVDDITGAPAMSQADIDEYIAAFASEWTAASLDGKLEMWAEEFMITQVGNGIDAYNLYRRTGYPKNLQPTIELNPGQFPLSMFYPSNHAGRNSNVNQKTDLAQRVFWNTNGPSVD
jgi:hypothetical protein